MKDMLKHNVTSCVLGTVFIEVISSLADKLAAFYRESFLFLYVNS